MLDGAGCLVINSISHVAWKNDKNGDEAVSNYNPPLKVKINLDMWNLKMIVSPKGTFLFQESRFQVPGSKHQGEQKKNSATCQTTAYCTSEP